MGPGCLERHMGDSALTQNDFFLEFKMLKSEFVKKDASGSNLWSLSCNVGKIFSFYSLRLNFR